MTLSCPAKINLTLEVLGRYPDGYHRIATVIQAISLADTLTMEPAGDLSFHYDQPGLSGDDNLVVRAARRLKEITGYQGGARIYLAKGIPEAAGLGGGSSDAAAALKGLNLLWQLDLPENRLQELGAGLGSDVPFFLEGSTALAEARGEQVTPLPIPATFWLVLLRPPIILPQKTRRLYAALTPGHYTNGERTMALAKTLRAGHRLSEEMLYNTFEQVAPGLFTGLGEYRRRFREAGAGRVHLAGSGPTLFALFEDRKRAEEVLARLDGVEAYLAHTSEAFT